MVLGAEGDQAKPFDPFESPGEPQDVAPKTVEAEVKNEGTHVEPARGADSAEPEPDRKSDAGADPQSEECTEGCDPCDAWVVRCVNVARQAIPDLQVLHKRSIASGTQVKVAASGRRATFNLYRNGNVQVQGSADSELVAKLNEIAWPRLDSSNRPAGNVNRSFLILGLNEESMKEALARVNDLTVQPHSPEDYVILDWHLLRGGDSLRLRAYYTEKVVLQGKRSALAAEVERALEAEMLRAGLDYHVRSSPKSVAKDQIDAAEMEVLEIIGHDASLFIGSELLHALAYCWVQVQVPPEGVQNVSFLLGPALPALESFWLQFAKRLDGVENGDSRGVGSWARKFLNYCERRRDARGQSIARRLKNAWDLRNRIAHPSEVVLDQRKCREELLKWLELMRDALKWMQKA